MRTLLPMAALAWAIAGCVAETGSSGSDAGGRDGTSGASDTGATGDARSPGVGGDADVPARDSGSGDGPAADAGPSEDAARDGAFDSSTPDRDARPADAARGPDASPRPDAGIRCAAGDDCPAPLACHGTTGQCIAECQHAEECRAGEACAGGRCGPCAVATDCPAGMLCVDDACTDCSGPDGGQECVVQYDEGFECRDNDRCAPSRCVMGRDCYLLGQVCEDNVCAPCRDSADCLAETTGEYPERTSCVEGTCLSGDCQNHRGCPGDNPICGDRRSCRRCQQHAECLLRAGVGDGWVCALNTGRCEPGDCYPAGSVCGAERDQICGADYTCGACIAGEAGNAQCAVVNGDAYLCVEGRCRVGECNEWRRCRDGRTCSDEHHCVECSSDNHCPENRPICRGEVCDACVAGECGAGRVCVDGACTEGTCSVEEALVLVDSGAPPGTSSGQDVSAQADGFIAIWGTYEPEMAEPDRYRIAISLFRPDGSRRDADQILHGAGGEKSTYPSLADSGDGYGVAWATETGADWSTSGIGYAYVALERGVRLGLAFPERRVELPGSGAYPPTVVWTGSEFMAAWLQFTGNVVDGAIRRLTFTPDGDATEPEALVEALPGDSVVGFDAAASVEQRRLAVVWAVGPANGPLDVVLQVFDLTDYAPVLDAPVVVAAGLSGVASLSVAWRGDRIGVVWAPADDALTCLVRWQPYLPDGRADGPILDLKEAAGECGARTDLASSEAGWGVAWTDRGRGGVPGAGSWSIVFSLIGFEDEPVGDPIIVSAPEYFPSWPAITALRDRGFMALWSGRRDGDRQLLASPIGCP